VRPPRESGAVAVISVPPGLPAVASALPVDAPAGIVIDGGTETIDGSSDDNVTCSLLAAGLPKSTLIVPFPPFSILRTGGPIAPSSSRIVHVPIDLTPGPCPFVSSTVNVRSPSGAAFPMIGILSCTSMESGSCELAGC